MNCYYSNLIEGHDTHLVDFERALHGDYSADPVKLIFSWKPEPISLCSAGSTQVM